MFTFPDDAKQVPDPDPSDYAAQVRYSPAFRADILGGIELSEWATRDRTFMSCPREVREVALSLRKLDFPLYPGRRAGDFVQITYDPVGRQYTIALVKT